MKILIDGRSITPQISGIGRYIDELIRSYIKEYGKDSVIVILNYKPIDFPYNYLYCPYHRHSLLGNIRFSFYLYKLDYDIYHAGDLIGPFWRKRNVTHIVTVHDLMLLKVKGFSRIPLWKNALRKLKFYYFWSRILKVTDIIISVSKTTQKDVKEIFKLNSIVLREGLNYIQSDVVGCKKYEGISSGNYFLYVGLAMPHKNLDFLVNTFLKARTNKKLVICGKGHIPIHSDRIIYTGWVEDVELDFLYKHCAAFIFPSLYEGFGLPILEALSYHCRVFSSNAGSLGEFSKDVLSFFDPKDEKRLRYLIECCDEIPVNVDLIDDYLRNFDWKEIWHEFHQNLKSYLYEKSKIK